jgi:hypothetical protein
MVGPKRCSRPTKEGGSIMLDSETRISGVPPEAWEYQLSIRSAL